MMPSLRAALEIERSDIDGVPVLHLPMPGSTIVTLSFRVGRCDEPIALTGVTHLAEHLIMGKVEGAVQHANGQTAPYRVSFTRRGSPEECASFLRQVCEAIERPPIAKLFDEVNVLRTEAGGRGYGLFQHLAVLRFGYQGLGTLALPEFILRRPDPDVLVEWVGAHFVAGNAALWVAGDLPPDLALPLPSGPNRPPAPADPIPGLRTPCRSGDQAPAVAASFVGPRSMAISSALGILDARLRRALRVDRGIAYDIGADRVLVGGERQVIGVWATCLPEMAPQVTRQFLDEIDQVATTGPSDDELRNLVELVARDMQDPASTVSRLDRHVEDLLLGDAPITLGELADEIEHLTPQKVAAAMAELRESMLLVTPPMADFRDGPSFHPYPGPSQEPLGRVRSFEPTGITPVPPWRKAPYLRLHVGDLGVGFEGPQGRVSTVLWRDAVAVVDTDDVSRDILGRDGFTIPVNAAHWVGGREALQLAKRYAPASLLIPRGPWGAAPEPDAVADDAWRRRRPALQLGVSGSLMSLLWAMTSYPASGTTLLVGLAFTAVVVMLATTWSRG